MHGSPLQAYSILLILVGLLAIFIYDRWPYHIVAIGGLAFATVLGIVPLHQVYSGIDNPAVITVACVMAISYAITGSGIINLLVKKLDFLTKNTTMHILSFSMVSAILSGFMNNVGALGLMLPACIQSSWKHNRSPSLILIPVAMASALGGMMTLIGTPTNLIISAFREQSLGRPYLIFDFAHVGCFTAFLGTLFVSIIGWKLLQHKKAPAKEHTQIYTIELEINEKSLMIDQPVSNLKKELKKTSEIVGLFRNNRRCEITRSTKIKANDIFLLESSLHDIQLIANLAHATLLGQPDADKGGEHQKLIESMVPVGSKLIKKTIESSSLYREKKISVLAILRITGLPMERVYKQPIRLGDMLLLQCQKCINEADLRAAGLIQVSQHNLQIGSWRRLLAPMLIFIISLAAILLRLAPPEIAFGGAVFFIFALQPTSLQKLSEIINWPVIILIAAMIPLGTALIQTGAADMIANLLKYAIPHLPIIASLALMMFLTIVLSSFINNAATAVIMAPIAISVAQSTGLNVDAFLMATAIGASASFLTPVAHQNNLLVMEPGNYDFLDFLKVGIPLEMVVMLVSCPLLYYFWA